MRKLKNVQSILARNLQSKPQRHLVDCFFTLHSLQQGDTGDSSTGDQHQIHNTHFYNSETEIRTLNPTWKSLNLQSVDSSQLTAQHFVIRLWQAEDAAGALDGRSDNDDATVQVLCEYTVDLDALQRLGPDTQVLQRLPTMPANTVLFELNDGLYSFSQVVSPFAQLLEGRQSVRLTRRLAAETTRSRLQAIVSVHEKLQESKQGTDSVLQDLEARLHQHSRFLYQKQRREGYRAKLSLLKRELAEAQQRVQAQRQASKEEHAQMIPRARAIAEGQMGLLASKQDLINAQQELRKQKEVLFGLSKALQQRRQYLVQQLVKVFPVREVGTERSRLESSSSSSGGSGGVSSSSSSSSSGSGSGNNNSASSSRTGTSGSKMTSDQKARFLQFAKQVHVSSPLMSIRGITLPNGDYSGSDEEHIAAALGYTAQVVAKLADLLQVPLRYRIRPLGSRSIVCEEISQQPPNHEFPLYSKGHDNHRFEYAVYLLNKNIEQLLHTEELTGANLSDTLPNLHSLLTCSTLGSAAFAQTNQFQALDDPRDPGNASSSSSGSSGSGSGSGSGGSAGSTNSSTSKRSRRSKLNSSKTTTVVRTDDDTDEAEMQREKVLMEGVKRDSIQTSHSADEEAGEASGGFAAAAR